MLHETAIAADDFLVMAHGAPDEMVRAKASLGTGNPLRLDQHGAGASKASAEPLALTGA